MIKYYVNEKKRQVIAKLEGTACDAMDAAYRKSNSLVELTDAAIDILEMPDHFEARATCHPDDEFDVEKGKEIAKTKLMRKLITSKMNRLVEYYAWLGEQMVGMKSVLEWYTEKETTMGEMYAAVQDKMAETGIVIKDVED